MIQHPWFSVLSHQLLIPMVSQILRNEAQRGVSCFWGGALSKSRVLNACEQRLRASFVLPLGHYPQSMECTNHSLNPYGCKQYKKNCGSNNADLGIIFWSSKNTELVLCTSYEAQRTDFWIGEGWRILPPFKVSRPMKKLVLRMYVYAIKNSYVWWAMMSYDELWCLDPQATLIDKPKLHLCPGWDYTAVISTIILQKLHHWLGCLLQLSWDTAVNWYFMWLVVEIKEHPAILSNHTCTR